MRSNTDKELLDQEIDKWFEELEAQVDESEVARLAQAVLDRHANDRNNLDRKILDDFHGHAPTIDDTFQCKLPTITPKAQVFTQNLQDGQYFQTRYREGGGCSGFNYLRYSRRSRRARYRIQRKPSAVVDDMKVLSIFMDQK